MYGNMGHNISTRLTCICTALLLMRDGRCTLTLSCRTLIFRFAFFISPKTVVVTVAVRSLRSNEILLSFSSWRASLLGKSIAWNSSTICTYSQSTKQNNTSIRIPSDMIRLSRRKMFLCIKTNIRIIAIMHTGCICANSPSASSFSAPLSGCDPCASQSSASLQFPYYFQS